MEKNVSVEEKVKTRLGDPRLDKAWDYLKTNFGITKDSLTDKQQEFLAFGASTTLVTGTIKDKKGKDVEVQVSLRLAYSKEQQSKAKEERYPDKILATMPEQMKTLKNCLKEDGTINEKVARFQVTDVAGWFPIKSVGVLKNLLSVDYSKDGDDKKATLDFVNGGKVVKTPMTGDKEYLISLNRPTNTFIGVPVGVVQAYIESKVVGPEFTEQSKRNLANGRPVVLEVIDKKTGEKREAAYQFDVSKMAIVEIPLISRNKNTKDIEMWRQKSDQAVEKVEKPVEDKKAVQEKTTSKGKGEKKGVKPIEEAAKKEDKRRKMKV